MSPEVLILFLVAVFFAYQFGKVMAQVKRESTFTEEQLLNVKKLCGGSWLEAAKWIMSESCDDYYEGKSYARKKFRDELIKRHYLEKKK